MRFLEVRVSYNLFDPWIRRMKWNYSEIECSKSRKKTRTRKGYVQKRKNSKTSSLCIQNVSWDRAILLVTFTIVRQKNCAKAFSRRLQWFVESRILQGISESFALTYLITSHEHDARVCVYVRKGNDGSRMLWPCTLREWWITKEKYLDRSKIAVAGFIEHHRSRVYRRSNLKLFEGSRDDKSAFRSRIKRVFQPFNLGYVYYHQQFLSPSFLYIKFARNDRNFDKCLDLF